MLICDQPGATQLSSLEEANKEASCSGRVLTPGRCFGQTLIGNRHTTDENGQTGWSKTTDETRFEEPRSSFWKI